jgi:hypothetical protein
VKKRVGVVVAGLGAVALMTGGTAYAASSGGLGKPAITFGSPSPSEGATLTAGSAQFAFSYNRAPKQTQTVACVLSGPTASSGACNTPAAAGDGSSSGASYTGLASGSYTLTVTVTLTDGGTVSAVRDFTVAAPGQLYWTESADANNDPSSGSIMQAGLDGSNQATLISGQSIPFAVAVDGGNIYWTDQSDPSQDPDSGTIMTASLADPATVTTLESGQAGPGAVAVDGGSIYWADLFGGTIMTASLADPADVTTLESGQYYPDGVAVSGGNIYWADESGTIMTASLADPADVTTLESGLVDLNQITVSGSSIYWSAGQPNCPSCGTISQASLADPASVTTLATGQGYPQQIAVYDGSIYWADADGETITEVPLTGGTPATVVSDPTIGFGLAVGPT